MANTKSQPVTDREAVPQVFINQPDIMGDFESAMITTALGALAAADTYELIRLPSGSRILDILVAHDAMGTTLTLDFGIGTPNVGSAPTALDADILVNGYDAAAAQITWLSIFGFGLVAPEDLGKTLWEHAAVATDPRADYVVYVTCATSGTPLAADLNVWLKWANNKGAG